MARRVFLDVPQVVEERHVLLDNLEILPGGLNFREFRAVRIRDVGIKFGHFRGDGFLVKKYCCRLVVPALIIIAIAFTPLV